MLLACVGLMSINAFAQRICNTNEKMEAKFAAQPELRAKDAALRASVANKNYRVTKKSGVVTIPVVVHIIYKNDIQNISDEQIYSQLKVLNDDYRKLNEDFDTNVPDAFKPVAADLELAFSLATVAPDGSPTTGIERKQVPSNFNFDDNYYKTSGLTAWDTTKYLNIWVGNFTNGNLLGWAYPPSVAGQPDDGFCVTYKAFGTIGTAGTGGFNVYNKGRTATHEIGHYFGLAHIWGNSNNPTTCGTPLNDDWCDDTPATNQPYFNKPKYPDNKYVCTPTEDGAMFMNYMDYVDDGAMGLFTNDQKTIVQNVLQGPRASLLTSNGLAVKDIEKVDAIDVFPNPTNDFISVVSPSIQLDVVEIFGNDGRLIKKVELKNNHDKIDVKALPAGLYYLRTYSQKNVVKSLKFIKK